jgi:hypothetical protein
MKPGGVDSAGARLLSWIAPPLIGLAAFVAPVAIVPPARHHDAPLFPYLRDAVEEVGWMSLVALFVAGVVLGLLFRAAHPFRLGMLAIVLLPAAAIAEMFVDGAGHNLFPIEFGFYFVYGLVVVLGAALVRGLRRRFGRRNPDDPMNEHDWIRRREDQK